MISGWNWLSIFEISTFNSTEKWEGGRSALNMVSPLLIHCDWVRFILIALLPTIYFRMIGDERDVGQDNSCTKIIYMMVVSSFPFHLKTQSSAKHLMIPYSVYFRLMIALGHVAMYVDQRFFKRTHLSLVQITGSCLPSNSSNTGNNAP